VWDYVKSWTKDSVKPETRQLLVECIMEAAAGIRAKWSTFSGVTSDEKCAITKWSFQKFDFTCNCTLTKKSNRVFIATVHYYLI
jgi:hypothetical protein